MPPKEDKWHPYKMLKADRSSLGKELDTDSVFDSLASAPSSQPESLGPKTPPNFVEGPVSIESFNLTLLNAPSGDLGLLNHSDCTYPVT